jgi:ferredoxin
MLEVLERISRGAGKTMRPGLAELGEQIKASSLCGLGQTAPNPVLTTLRYFLEEYQAHIADKRCPAKVCLPLVEFWIDPEKCNGCDLCVPACAAGAISGERKLPHTIDVAACVKCARCLTVCRQDAIEKR